MLAYQKPSRTACLRFRDMIAKNHAVISETNHRVDEIRGMAEAIFREAREQSLRRTAQRVAAMKAALCIRVSM